MGSEYDGGLQIWRKRLGIWRKADGRRMEAHNILTPCPSLLTLGLFGIFGTKLICFTFCEPLHLARAELKVLSILTWERYRWFDGISGRFDCVGYVSRISRVAIPMIPAHMWTRLLSIDNGTNPSLCITFEHFGAALYIEYWTKFCGHVPLLETHPCPHVDIWIKQGSNITNVGHYLRSDQYQHLHKSTQRKTRKYLLDSYFGWVWLAGERSGALEWIPCHIQLFIHFNGRKGLNTSKYVSRKSRKYGKSCAPQSRTKAFLRHSRVELSQLIPGRILCE